MSQNLNGWMRASRLLRGIAAVLVLIAIGVGCQAQAADPLEAGFAALPHSARPHTWWHWMNNNSSFEGITRDLEAMKEIGLGGAQIFNAAVGVPSGKVPFLSDEWLAMTHHAIAEADRLGLEICMHNCAGWSSSGGPWITPPLAMQMVTTSETTIHGPRHMDETLPQPPTRCDYYKDIAVLAFPTPSAEATDMMEANPTITASQGEINAEPMFDGDPNTWTNLIARGRANDPYLQFEFATPFTARSLMLLPGGGAQGTTVVLSASQDGQEFQQVTAFGIADPTILRPVTTVSFPATTAPYWRLGLRRSRRGSVVVPISELRLCAAYRVSNLAGKAGYVRQDMPGADTTQVTADNCIPRDSIVNLSDRMDASGRFTWDVPEGKWTILRIGHTPTGKTNHPAPVEGTGLECDKLSREAAEVNFEGMVGKVIADIGPLTGRGLQDVLIDSYEVDTQNWTPRFRQDFEARRGYDPLLYLPAMTGWVVDSLDETERFLWDVRQTVADLFEANYFGRTAELCHEHGLRMSVEAYGNGSFNNLGAGSRADIPMSEFWCGWGGDISGPKEAASTAHTWGKTFVGAESFTTGEAEGRWQNHPYSIKALGDLMFCGGINRYIFHRYAHQPYERAVPGLTLGPHGMHFERTNTWWKPGAAWIQYVTRCQYLLQSGLFAADLVYLVPEGAPCGLPGRGGLRPVPPTGYDYDGCSPDAVLRRMTVRDGRIVLPDGMSYRVLVLPESDTMSVKLLSKVRELVAAGATVVGPRPKAAPGLQDYPVSSARVQALAAEIWGACDGKTVTQNRFGDGRVVWGRPLAGLLDEMGIQPDFACVAKPGVPATPYIHRTAGGTDLYFVSNQLQRRETYECSFRVADREPELWHPDTGAIEPAPLWRREGARTVVTLPFDPAGSVFVVFRHPARPQNLVSLTLDGQAALEPVRPRAASLRIVKAVYGVLGVSDIPDCVDVTRLLAGRVADGALTVVANNLLAGDPANQIVKQMRVDYTYNGVAAAATVDENETMRLPDPAMVKPGEPGELVITRALYGVLPDFTAPPPEKPWVDVTAIVAANVRDGAVSVKASNDLAGDPASLIVKQMMVDYELDGQPYSVTVPENGMLALPTGSEAAMVTDVTPSPVLRANGGAPVVTAWRPGAYVGQTADGKVLRAVVDAVPETVEIGGPWPVSFPPDWGAPPSATFDKLISWSDSDVPGIRYFSGTATYERDIEVPAALLGEGKALLLDLGDVQVMAHVWFNGQDLGVLWKPPFTVDISRLARPGANRLKLEVTNLWPNRMIGDEQCPPDADYGGGGNLLAWPKWLLTDEPRTSGRYTLATWKHYNAGSPLLPSGLLGPVALRPGVTVELRPL